jgi:hypothetical protein
VLCILFYACTDCTFITYHQVKECVIKTHEVSGNYKYNWKIGVAPRETLSGVCRECFINCYNVSGSYVDNIVIAIKNGERSVDGPLNDHANPARTNPGEAGGWFRQIGHVADSFGITLSFTQMAAMQIPNTEASLSCFAWMHTFFDMVGDKEPDREEIHLDAQPIRAIHDEYKDLMVSLSAPFLGYSNFINVWKSCFSHVKIREYKAVSGKCEICAALTDMRRRKLDAASRRYVVELFALHRSMYMGERLTYYHRRNDAFLMPTSYLSMIADGMQQSHCLLPWQGNLNTFAPCLTQHLQGVLMHGRSTQIFRTFHNLCNSSNLSVHCLLMSLEIIMVEEGKLPDTIYYQIDGGAENVSKSVLGICELLVARGLCKKLVLTRLPVGHTHEDIDSKFALIWKRMRDAFILTPQHYSEAVVTSLTTLKLACQVHNIFAIPNYTKYIDSYLDKKLGRYAKRGRTGQDWTQLQWTFVAVPMSVHFPCGVKTTYRKYACDEVILIMKNKDSPTGFEVCDLKVADFPALATDCPAGMHVLHSLPTVGVNMEPEPFVTGSRQVLEDVVKQVAKKFGNSHPEVLLEWIQFRDEAAPQNDNANDYCSQNGLSIPLKDILFAGVVHDAAATVAPRMGAGERKRMRATDSVTFVRTGRGAAELSPYAEVGTAAGGAASGGAAANTANTAKSVLRIIRQRQLSILAMTHAAIGRNLKEIMTTLYIHHCCLALHALLLQLSLSIRLATSCWIQMTTFDSAFWLFVRVERTAVGGAAMFHFFMNIRRPMMPTLNLFILRVVKC